MSARRLTLGCVAVTLACAAARAQAPAAQGEVVRALLGDRPSSELREVVDQYATDRAGMLRRYEVEYSPGRRKRLVEFYTGWRAQLQKSDFAALGAEGRIDFTLLDNRLRYELALLAREEKLFAEAAPYAPFATAIMELQESRRRMEPVNPSVVAKTLSGLATRIDSMRKGIEQAAKKDSAAANGAKDPPRERRIVAFRSAQLLESLGNTLRGWYRYYSGYDPMFTWWVSDPYRKADSTLKLYVKALREKVVGFKENEDPPIIGDPIGSAALKEDLAFELIPYTPEELVAIAEREYAWCEAEMKKASRAMGFGDDWKAALEKVKNTYVEPGKQPDLIRDLAHEAVAFIEQRNLVTVPSLAKEIWRMEMMTPEAQKVSPFFLGGEVIQVSYPTDGMAHEDKLMSLRGNNPHFSRATVHHELIPGHHLQGFMTARYNSHRRAFSTPFWGEGWALYWEMLLWDQGFPATPENRVGMLFWRMHRAARIIFSLRFHLGTMTPQQAIDFLVDRVGHERANATAEVRRSFNGSYPPLYQLAYMIGGLQLRALHAELVGSGRMTNRDFHDAILRGGSMPIEMVRARLMQQPPARDYRPGWRFSEVRISGRVQ